MMKKQEKTVVVIGMHRSGTSVISSIISCLGVNLGDRLLGAFKGNPTGHFEDLDFLELNTKILRAGNGEWDCPPDNNALEFAWGLYRDEVRELIERKNKNNIVWGWKEPRTSLFLDKYIPILRSPLLIYCDREDQEVVSSLIKRDGMLEAYAAKLVKEYRNRINTYLSRSKVPILYISFKDLRNNPRQEIGRIIEFLCIDADEKLLDDCVRRILQPEVLLKMKVRKRAYYDSVLNVCFHPEKVYRHLLLKARLRQWRRKWFE